MTNRNAVLREFADRFRLNGDLLTCQGCHRSQIASREDEDFVHGSDCRLSTTGGRPWSELCVILMLPAGGGS